MLVKQQFDTNVVSQESEAFQATCVVFKIDVRDLVKASGVSREIVERFKIGDDSLNTAQLYKLKRALTAEERNFYNSMLVVQSAAADAGILLPLLDLSETNGSVDLYRDAVMLTCQIFGIQQNSLCKKSGIFSSNFSAWALGRRDMTVNSFYKIKAALSREERSFLDAVINILLALDPQKVSHTNLTEVKSNQKATQLRIA
jgi:transcriptional regulator with XRE-family HTH domain